MTGAGKRSGPVDPDPVLRVLDELNRALRARDVEGTLRLFARAPDVLLLGSEAAAMARGPGEMRAFLERLFARPQSYGWEWSDHFVSQHADTAWLLATGEVVVREGEAEARGPYRATLVLTRQGDGWAIAHFHGSEPAPPPV